MVEVFLKAGADPNAEKDDDNKTPLIFASEEGYSRICSILLEAGANVNHEVGEEGTVALKAAVTHDCREAALVLMEHGATCSLAILEPEELERLTGWMAEQALKDKEKAMEAKAEKAMEEKDAQMERLVQGIPEWCAQASSAKASSSEGQQGGCSITPDPLQPGNGYTRKRKHEAPAAEE